MSFTKDDLKLDGLEKLEKILRQNKIQIQIGILGDKAQREGENTNAAIGAAHEYGSTKRNLPERSFLRMPMNTQYFSNLESSGLFKKTFEQIIKENGVKGFAKKLANVAERTVKEAFNTGGFGQWAKWKNPNYENNANMILVNTQQLRDSITTKVTIHD